jgi:TonB family protein
MAWYIRADSHGSAAAQNNIGSLYLNGLGVETNYARALLGFQRAADKGNSDGENSIGFLYEKGWVKQDYAEAEKWYRKAADQGNSRGIGNLGWLYLGGNGVQQDYAEALKLLSEAADAGIPESQVSLGWMYERGLGVGHDYAEAMKWYRKAADQNNAQAELNIGRLYQKGLGVEADNSEAANWLRKAAAKGNRDAIANLLSDHHDGELSGAGAAQPPHVTNIIPICKEKTTEGCVSPPQAIFSPEPEYSKEAREAKYQGTCVIGLIVEADGSTSHVALISGLGKGLDEKALAAVKSWKFKPALTDGKPVATQIAVEVDFHLN